MATASQGARYRKRNMLKSRVYPPGWNGLDSSALRLRIDPLAILMPDMAGGAGARRDSVVLAYSGGLDTSVAIRWINEKYDLDVIAVTVDVGNEKDFEVVRQKALRTGAIKAFVKDAKSTFVSDFVFPSLQAGTLYQNVYPLATALARPLIAKQLVDYARQEGASHVAHGCTGKGNDQVRFDVSVQALAPDLKIIAPVREWRMTRDEEIRYAQQH